MLLYLIHYLIRGRDVAEGIDDDLDFAGLVARAASIEDMLPLGHGAREVAIMMLMGIWSPRDFDEEISPVKDSERAMFSYLLATNPTMPRRIAAAIIREAEFMVEDLEGMDYCPSLGQHIDRMNRSYKNIAFAVDRGEN
jgi:hypothetical protein